jgi:predicted membrane protein
MKTQTMVKICMFVLMYTKSVKREYLFAGEKTSAKASFSLRSKEHQRWRKILKILSYINHAQQLII